MDDQERYQARKIAEMMNSEGWAFLLGAWAQKRESNIIAKLKRTTSEMPWRQAQGRLEGFDEAVNLADRLTADLDEAHDEKTAAEEAAEVISNLRGGQK